MYFIFVETDFEASHQLTFADGTQEPLHSHRWRVTAAVCAADVNEQGFVMDFLELKRLLTQAIKPFSGRQLEHLPSFCDRGASAEAVARIVFDTLQGQIPCPARLKYIEVIEAQGCRARFQPDA